MFFMVIEHFKDGAVAAVYERFETQGRMLPDGLTYIDSWIETSFGRCFQLMECQDPSLFQEWISHWHDLVDFEIVPVRSSKEAASIITSSP